MNATRSLLAGAIFGAVGVALGAFGAHVFRPMLTETCRLETYELAVRYEFYHALALLISGVTQLVLNNKFIRLAAFFFVAGIFLFSGSLYLLCFTQIKIFAIITPLGGLALIAGWVLLAIGVSGKLIVKQ